MVSLLTNASLSLSLSVFPADVRLASGQPRIGRPTLQGSLSGAGGRNTGAVHLSRSNFEGNQGKHCPTMMMIDVADN